MPGFPSTLEAARRRKVFRCFWQSCDDSLVPTIVDSLSHEHYVTDLLLGLMMSTSRGRFCLSQVVI